MLSRAVELGLLNGLFKVFRCNHVCIFMFATPHEGGVVVVI